MGKKEIRVLFVCLGNICRSPAAEGILKHLLQEVPDLKVYVESCGLDQWHVGRSPDARMTAKAASRGFYLEGKAQLFDPSFFHAFDYILAADQEVLQTLYDYAQPHHKSKIYLMTHFSTLYKGKDVPDPYYNEGFDKVMDILEDSCKGFIKHLIKNK